MKTRIAQFIFIVKMKNMGLKQNPFIPVRVRDFHSEKCYQNLLNGLEDSS